MRVPIPFDKEQINVEETLLNARWYIVRCDEAITNLKINRQEAMGIYKQINERLKEEHHHYGLVRVQNDARELGNETLFYQYRSTIAEALARQNKKTSYAMLGNNIEEIRSSLSYYENQMN